MHSVKGVRSVRNEIQVAGPNVSDAELQQKLIRAISYDRVGYGTTAFNAIGIHVENGNVTLTGHAYGPVDADSAVAVAANTPGVKDVTNNIEVDPLSPMDDRIRLAVFRSVYSFPSLNKYAIDPAKPIRISVQNGMECPATFVPVEMRQTGTRGVANEKRDEAYGGAGRESAATG